MLSQGFAFRYRLLPAPGYEYVSPAVEDVTGYAAKEFYADPRLDERIVYRDDLPRMLQIIQDRASSGVLRFVCRDGSVVWAMLNTVPVVNDDDELVAIEGLARFLCRDGEAMAIGPDWLSCAALSDLSEREREVLGSMARGLTNAQIAAMLCISERTVQHHVGHILTKLSAPNRTAAAAAAFSLGLFGSASEFAPQAPDSSGDS